MVELIAEVATNHGGSIGRAIKFAEAFARAGADVIKFQYTRAHRLAPNDPQLQWFEQAELSEQDFEAIADAVELTLHRTFMLTVYHPGDVKAVRDLTHTVKVGSGEAHDTKLAEAILGTTFRRVVVSAGIRPINALYEQDPRVQRLACISRYPHPAALVPAAFLQRLPDGWSDHSEGLDGCMTAIHLGAKIIEKHVQLKEQARTPQAYEATVEEFATLRQWADKDPQRFLGRWNYAH